VTCIPITWQRLGKYIPAEANARNNATYIVRQKISKHASLTTEDVFSAWSVHSGYKEVFSNIVNNEIWGVVKKWVEFWRRQSKVIEMKWQEMN
jgi:hypothetical protein